MTLDRRSNPAEIAVPNAFPVCQGPVPPVLLENAVQDILALQSLPPLGVVVGLARIDCTFIAVEQFLEQF